MAQITPENFINSIKQEFPDFIPYWNSYLSYNGSESGIIVRMIPVGDYIVDAMKSNNEIILKNIFDFLEFAYINGDDNVQTAITTGLLEYLMHQDSGHIKFSKFCKYLGENALAYCRAWDEFNGVKTEGLW